MMVNAAVLRLGKVSELFSVIFKVIDEQEFLEFYHGLLDRGELRDIFVACTHQYKGQVMTLEELRHFMTQEQKQEVTNHLVL